MTQLRLPDLDEGREHDGKAMSALTDQQRTFVILMLEQGVNPKAASAAAVKAGYAPNYGYALMRSDRVLAALREEATKRLAGAALVGVNVMLQIAQDPTHKDQYKAAKDLAAINGFTAEQKIVVEHINPQDRAVIDRIRQMAEQLGVDPRLLIEQAGVVIDAEFEVVQPGATIDDSDW